MVFYEHIEIYVGVQIHSEDIILQWAILARINTTKIVFYFIVLEPLPSSFARTL